MIVYLDKELKWDAKPSPTELQLVPDKIRQHENPQTFKIKLKSLKNMIKNISFARVPCFL